MRPIIAALLLMVVGCAEYTPPPKAPKSRKYEHGKYDSTQPTSDGSLWQDSARGLFADFRGTRVGDLVTILVDESPEAQGNAGTEMDRNSEVSAGVPSFFGLTQAMKSAYPDIEPEELFKVMSTGSFDGTGQTKRGSRVRSPISVRVKQTMPNGDLFIEGNKTLLVNDEELRIYISGVIRPEDIQTDNTVNSSRIADAEVEFTGRGVLTDNQRQGWLTRIISSINPF